MNKIFEIVDKSGRLIYLSNERWKHICHEHPELGNNLGVIEETLTNPTKIITGDINLNVGYYYKYLKERVEEKYLLVIISIGYS